MKKLTCLVLAALLLASLLAGCSGVSKEDHEAALSQVEELKSEIKSLERDYKKVEKELAKEKEKAEELEKQLANTGEMNFIVYNSSPYTIWAIDIAPEADPGRVTDILSMTLSSESSYTYESSAHSSLASYDRWTFYVIDIDDDTSVQAYIINPWTLKSVDIVWNNDRGGYECEFFY